MPPPNRKKYHPTLSGNQILNLPELPPPVPIDLRNEFEKQYDKYVGPPSRFVKSLIAPIDPETGLPNVDVAGPVMVGKAGGFNADKLLYQILQTGAKTKAEVATEFIKRKYPRIAGLVSGIKTVPQEAVSDSLLGQYIPGKNIAQLVENPKGEEVLRQYVDTLGHELTHGAQYNIPEMGRKVLPRRYISHEIPSKVIGHLPGPQRDKLNKIRFEMYKKQPMEIQARQGGDTGVKAFDNFIDQIIPQKVFSVADPITKDNSLAVKKLINYDNDLILEAPSIPEATKIAIRNEIKQKNDLIDKAVATGNKESLRVRDVVPHIYPKETGTKKILRDSGFTKSLDPSKQIISDLLDDEFLMKKLSAKALGKNVSMRYQSSQVTPFMSREARINRDKLAEWKALFDSLNNK